MRQRLQAAPKLGVVAGILMVLAFASSSWSFHNARVQACQARNQTLDVIAGLLADSRAAAFARRRSPEERMAEARYYAIEFGRVNDARC